MMEGSARGVDLLMRREGGPDFKKPFRQKREIAQNLGSRRLSLFFLSNPIDKQHARSILPR